jgi:Putative phage serine protease XkdF
MKVTITEGGKTVVVDDGKPEPAGVASTLIKSDEARRFTLSVAYFADKPDVGKAADGYRDFAPAPVVEDGAWGFMKSSREVGLWHDDGTQGRGEVVESYIYRGPDWTPEFTDCMIKAGDWLTGIVWDEATWPLVLEGKITGTSPQGQAARKTATAAGRAGLRKSAADEPEVTPDDEGLTEITKILADRIDGVIRPANGAPFLLIKHLEPDAVPAAAAEPDEWDAVAKSEDDAYGQLVKKHRDFTMDERKAAAKSGNALPDGSYPIPDTDALRRAAILARSGHGNAGAARALIAKRARELGVPNPLEKKAKMKKQAEEPLAEAPAGDTAVPGGYIARDEFDQLVKSQAEAKAAHEAELQVLRADLAKALAEPRSGGPVMSATGTGTTGSGAEAEAHLAKARGYEAAASRVTDPLQRTGYVAMAAEERQKAAQLTSP